jgi:hypothetical protein
MATIIPKDEKVKQAIKWISDESLECANTDMVRLVSKATIKFDLSPKEEAFLISFYRENKC